MQLEGQAISEASRLRTTLRLVVYQLVCCNVGDIFDSLACVWKCSRISVDASFPSCASSFLDYNLYSRVPRYL